MDVLEIDLNELVTKQVNRKIKKLETELAEVYEKNREQARQLVDFQRTFRTRDYKDIFLETLRASFLKISSTENASQTKNRFDFIVNLMQLLYGIDLTYTWTTNCEYDHYLSTYLAVNYYTHKDKIIQLLYVLYTNPESIVDSIQSFVMPKDYPKEEVLEYVRNPHYCVNGHNFGFSPYWMEYKAGKRNLPHNLIMENPYILDEDVFEMLLNTIRTNKANSYYLFALPKYNQDISATQIEALGECLIGLNKTVFDYDCVKEFVRTNMLHFNNKTLDYLYTLATSDNQYRLFHWGHFPKEYQKKFIRKMDIEQVLKILTDYSCKLSSDDKVELLRELL